MPTILKLCSAFQNGEFARRSTQWVASITPTIWKFALLFCGTTNLAYAGKEGEHVKHADTASLGDTVVYTYAILNSGSTTVLLLELEDNEVRC